MTEDIELAAVKARHKKRVERRGKFLATLTAEQRQERDRYVGWLRTWRCQYKGLAKNIAAKKRFVRGQGHNDLLALRVIMGELQGLRHQAHTMLLGRAMFKAFHKLREDARAAV